MTDRAGKELWIVDTNQPANTFSDYLISEKSLVIWFKNSEDVMIGIDLQNGVYKKK